MLKLHFSEAGPGPVVERGPYPAVRIGGISLRADDGTEIAQHREHCWFVGAKRFFRIDFDSPVHVRFEADGDTSEVLPFARFSSADGIAYGDGEAFAHVDPESNCWYSRIHERNFGTLIVRAAADD